MLRRMLVGHTKPINVVDFNDIVLGSKDETIKVWLTSKGELVRTYLEHFEEIVYLQSI